RWLERGAGRARRQAVAAKGRQHRLRTRAARVRHVGGQDRRVEFWRRHGGNRARGRRGAGRSAAPGRSAAAWPQNADKIPGDRECAFPLRSAARHAPNPRGGGRTGGVAVCLPAAAVHYHQQWRPAGGYAAGRARPGDLAGHLQGRKRCGRAAALADRAPAPGLIRVCQRPSRGRCGRETAPPILCWRCGKRDPGHRRLLDNLSPSGLNGRNSSEMHSGNNTVGIEATGALEAGIGSATRGMLGYRQPDGHWVFELEADCTIPAEYVLLRHYLGEEVDAVLEAKIANYLRRVQGAHGGWPLVHEGEFDMSASVKAYFALKTIGDSADAPHMARARQAIRWRGGAVHSNVFTRYMLAMFGVLTWRSVPVLPVEIMLLPLWSPFHLNKISYWARTTIVPLLVLAALKPRAKNESGVGIDELFLEEPHSIGMTAKAPHQSWGWFALFRGL